jgi:tetratricopeptide (TPR) repeat protein
VLSIDADEVFESRGSTLRKRLSYAADDTYGVRIINTGNSSVDDTFEFTAKRVFRRVGHHWVGHLHEQVATEDGSVTVGGLLGGIRLRHSGYADAGRLSTEKSQRNTALAREQLAGAEKAGDAPGMAVARVHLARSLIMSRQYAESAEVAEQAWADAALVTDQIAQALAFTQYKMCLTLSDTDTAMRWVERWRTVQPHNPAVDVAAAEVFQRAGNPKAGLEALDRVPTVSRDGAGGQLRRSDSINLEVALLAEDGRAAQALDLVREALRSGNGDPWPFIVHAALGDDAIREVLPALNDDQWRRWALLCVRDSGRGALRVLELMDEFHPGDAAVLASAARVAPLHGLEVTAEWDARLRKWGLSQMSPLIAFAADHRATPADRAIAAALAVSAYNDGRGIPHLENALGRVPTQGQKELAQALEIVAPGLVSFD